jgi:hypothetical protein
MTQIAEIAERGFFGSKFFTVCAASPAESGPEREPLRERKRDGETSLGRKEEWASHDSS